MLFFSCKNRLENNSKKKGRKGNSFLRNIVVLYNSHSLRNSCFQSQIFFLFISLIGKLKTGRRIGKKKKPQITVYPKISIRQIQLNALKVLHIVAKGKNTNNHNCKNK